MWNKLKGEKFCPFSRFQLSFERRLLRSCYLFWRFCGTNTGNKNSGGYSQVVPPFHPRAIIRTSGRCILDWPLALYGTLCVLRHILAGPLRLGSYCAIICQALYYWLLRVGRGCTRRRVRLLSSVLGAVHERFGSAGGEAGKTCSNVTVL